MYILLFFFLLYVILWSFYYEKRTYRRRLCSRRRGTPKNGSLTVGARSASRKLPRTKAQSSAVRKGGAGFSARCAIQSRRTFVISRQSRSLRASSQAIEQAGGSCLLSPSSPTGSTPALSRAHSSGSMKNKRATSYKRSPRLEPTRLSLFFFFFFSTIFERFSRVAGGLNF